MQTEKRTPKELKAAFDLIDKNKDGLLTPEEIYKIFRDFGYRQTKKEITEMFINIDKNKDGKIDFPEFCDLVKINEEEQKKVLRAKRKSGNSGNSENSMSPAEEEVFDSINKFRESPISFKDLIKNFINGMKQLNPKDPMINDYNILKGELQVYQTVPALRYSKELSEAARNYLEKCKAKPPKKTILYKNECKINI